MKQEASTARVGSDSEHFSQGEMVKAVWGHRDDSELVAIQRDGKNKVQSVLFNFLT